MNTEQQIGFDKVKEMWAQLAITAYAKEKIAEIMIITDEKELRHQLKETTDSRNMIERLGNPPLQDVTEIREILQAAVRGDCLTPYQLERVEKVLVVVDRLKQYLARGKQYGNPLAYYDENLDERGELREEIVSQIRSEVVDDRATKVLFDLRTRITALEETMKQKADQLIRNNKELMADTYHTIRSGRVCVPVKKEYRFRIPGSVIDKSATGNTVFIEPAPVAKLDEELQLLRVDEENEVYRILYTLSSMVADALPAMEENMRMIEKLDFLFSKGKLSVDLACCEPAINLNRHIMLKGARHPLMDRTINVPLDFEMGSSERGIVITGPNTGGKTVAIKTVMINCYMAQCGLHVCCKEGDICMNSNYLSDIGDGQDLSENLSTFSAHIKNVLAILAAADRESFVIMDELGSGTDPAEGMGIAVAILTELLKSGANFLVTTHYPEIKDFASKNENIVNARMTFDKETLMPTYRMVIGEAGESCAFYIADRLGMPGYMLETAAKAAYGEKAAKLYSFANGQELKKTFSPKITKVKKAAVNNKLDTLYNIGDSVIVYPEKKIGIVCETVNNKGTLRVQVAGRKFWINHKRVKLHVKAEELYPEDYDFSIIFDSVEERKIRHDMQRKYTDEVIVTEREEV